MKRSSIEVLQEKIEKLEAKLKILYAKEDKEETKMRGYRQKLRDICKCDGEYYVKDDYEGGSYYDREKYIKRWYCAICDKLLKEDIKTGSYG